MGRTVTGSRLRRDVFDGELDRIVGQVGGYAGASQNAARSLKISIVVPAYNEEEVIGPCLEAIQGSVDHAALKHDEYEIIVVNNASTDRTREIAASYSRVRVVDEQRKGLTRAKEAGFRAARGALIAHPDSDTLMPLEWISRALAEFERNPGLVALSGPYIYYDAPRMRRWLTAGWLGAGFLFHLAIQHVLRVGAMMQGGNYVVRRAALEKIGGYDTSIEFYGEDFDIASRLSKIGMVKWTWNFPLYSSARRLAAEGNLRTALRYGVNNVASVFLKRPLTQDYTDIRPPLGERARAAAARVLRGERL